ncbi:hypothetical protein AB1L07_02685 [Niallia alba]|uniref:hypothetical protein n=1 Tax=Niallia alba TaxID=2729105 RepID=UPI0039A1225B
MYDIRFWQDNEEYTERFEFKDEARERYEELINENSCAWIEFIKLIDNWVSERDQ